MGQLRIEPKEKTLEREVYQGLAAMLREGRKLANEQHVYYDLDPGEVPSEARRNLLYVARKAKIGLQVNRKHGTRALALRFQHSVVPVEHKPRLVIADAKQTVLAVLKAADCPKSRNQLEELIPFEMTPSQWGGVLRQLLEEKAIVKEGAARNTQYSIVSVVEPKKSGATRLVKKKRE